MSARTCCGGCEWRSAARIAWPWRSANSTAETSSPPSLARFLEQTDRELDDVYDAGGWTTLRRRAGVLPADATSAEDAAEVDDLSRRLGRLQHVDEPERLRTYRDVLRKTRPLDDLARRRFLMLESQLHHRGVLRAAESAIDYFAARPSIVDELEQLREVLEERVAVTSEVRPVAEWPLALHRHYERREIAAAVGYVTAGAKNISLQGGILKLRADKRELLFVTLDKSGKGFSPTTRYRDYAISPDLFHWETQGNASVTQESGRRYVESDANGWSFYLFVRPDPEQAFAFLGPVRYETHAGDRPIAITWRLLMPMPAALFDQFATLRPG